MDQLMKAIQVIEEETDSAIITVRSKKEFKIVSNDFVNFKTRNNTWGAAISLKDGFRLDLDFKKNLFETWELERLTKLQVNDKYGVTRIVHCKGLKFDTVKIFFKNNEAKNYDFTNENFTEFLKKIKEGNRSVI